MQVKRIACIGLGRMGWHIAAHLSAHGGASEAAATVAVFDANRDAGSNWLAEHNGLLADGAAEAAQGAQFIVTSLPADEQLRSVAQQILPVLESGAVWLDHSTTSAQAARITAIEVADRGASFLDGPVSGGVDGARQGSLTVMVGGDPVSLDMVRSLVNSYAARTTHMGSSGAGQITKMTNQICVIGLCQALAEGLDFARRSGLDVQNVVQVMLQGSSASWQMENRADKMLAGEYDFGFSTTLMRKDVGLVLAQAKAIDMPLPVTTMVAQFLDELDAMGGAQWDWCSLIERQKRQGETEE